MFMKLVKFALSSHKGGLIFRLLADLCPGFDQSDGSVGWIGNTRLIVTAGQSQKIVSLGAINGQVAGQQFGQLFRRPPFIPLDLT